MLYMCIDTDISWKNPFTGRLSGKRCFGREGEREGGVMMEGGLMGIREGNDILIGKHFL